MNLEKRSLGVACIVLLSPLLNSCLKTEHPDPCPEKNYSLWHDSITRYMNRSEYVRKHHPQAKTFEYAEEPFYNSSKIDGGIWGVPIKIEDQKFFAMITCNGTIEVNPIKY